MFKCQIQTTILLEYDNTTTIQYRPNNKHTKSITAVLILLSNININYYHR